ncbi:hypothetical protein D3C84_804030 [compost metagenome]
MVVALALVRLAIGRPDLLLEAVCVSRAGEWIDQVTPLALRVAEHGVHGVDPVLHRWVCRRCDDCEAGLLEHRQVRDARVDRLP